MISVAIMIAVEEPGSEFTKIGCPDRLTAQHTRGLLGGLSVIHQYEFHVTPPGATQNAASDEWEDIRWGSAEVISAVGSSQTDLFRPNRKCTFRLRRARLGCAQSLWPGSWTLVTCSRLCRVAVRLIIGSRLLTNCTWVSARYRKGSQDYTEVCGGCLLRLFIPKL